MKHSLECSVQGRIRIGTQLKVIDGLKEYVLVPDQHGWLSSIKIIAKVESPEKYFAKIEPSTGEAKFQIHIGGDRTKYLELVREFQELEAILSFSTNGCLKNISWDSPTDDFLPETEEEKKLVKVHGIHVTKDYPNNLKLLSEKTFEHIIKTKDRYKSLIVAKAFYKDGINEFTSRRYINAFYNFYFILEDLYGEGNTKNNYISSAFRASKDFRFIIEWVMKDILTLNIKHENNIKQFCIEENVTYDIDGLIDLLLKVRGNLHHYSSKSSKHLGTPFSHEEFESIAFLTMGLALQSIQFKILEINKSTKTTNV